MTGRGKPRKHDYEAIARFWHEGENHRLTQDAFVDAYYQATDNELPTGSLWYIMNRYAHLFTRDASDG